MGRTTTLTIRVDQEVKDQLETLAKQQKRSKSFVAAEAIAEYLDVQRWQVRRIEDALAAVDRGEGVPHQSVMDWIETWDTGNERPPPGR